MINFPNAKINLGLNIIEKRQDNFHNIETVFYPVPWFDGLEITTSGNFDFTSSSLLIEVNTENNLCVKVFDIMKKQYQLPNIKIHLLKSIPIGAGLGGGSSDAAFTVKLIKETFNLTITETEMEDIVRPLGSDCAFFIRNKPVFASGKGDIFESISLDLSGKWILLVYPNLHISTKTAYEGISPAKPKISIREIIQENLCEWKALLKNDFENSLFPKYPVLKEIKEFLYGKGALYSSMSGSGSTIFGIFDLPLPELVQAFPSEYKVQTGILK